MNSWPPKTHFFRTPRELRDLVEVPCHGIWVTPRKMASSSENDDMSMIFHDKPKSIAGKYWILDTYSCLALKALPEWSLNAVFTVTFFHEAKGKSQNPKSPFWQRTYSD